MTGTRELLTETAAAAADYLESLDDRPVGARASLDELRASIDVDLDDEAIDAFEVVRALREASDRGITAMGSGRYFGFVIGGALPASLAADWLASTWDQNAGLYVGGPAAAVVEETAGRWLKEILGIPDTASFALVTGCQMAHFTALSAARLHVLDAVGWDVNEYGLHGAPEISVIVGADRHVTVDRALRYLGIGKRSIVAVDTDRNGRMLVDSLAAALDERGAGPTIVCAQVGEVNTGAIDDVGAICELGHSSGAWVHVDGAFGLWAAASPTLRRLVDGVGLADSWATDAHKWLNVPYDSGLAFCAHPVSHRRAMSVHADYLVHGDATGPREQMDWTPEFSRRARGFAVYAALRSLGRRGVGDMVDRSCAQARALAASLAETDGVEVINDVMLNQVLVRFDDDDAQTQEVLRRVQESGEAWMSGTVWRGRAAMRISVVNWQTTDDDVRRTLAAIVAAHRSARAATSPA